MEKLNEFKRELSKLTGVDLFNPKYRELFKRYFEDDKDAVNEKEVEALEAKGIIEHGEMDNEPKDEPKNESEVEKDEPKAVDPEVVEDKLEDIDKAEDEREIDKIEEDKADEPKVEEEKKEEVAEESEEIGKEVDEVKDDKYKEELLDTKIELELVKNGVRPERLESAKKFAKFEINSLEELDKIHELLKEYPEWVRGYRPENFGHDFGRQDDGLTEEEKRLKQMGIDPRD